MSMGETLSLNCGHKRAYCLSPKWYMNIERHGGTILTRKTEELGENPVLLPFWPPQIPLGLNLARTLASAMRGRRPAWSMARPA